MSLKLGKVVKLDDFCCLVCTEIFMCFKMSSIKYCWLIYIWTKDHCLWYHQNAVTYELEGGCAIVPCVFLSFNWLTLTFEMYFVRFHHEAASSMQPWDETMIHKKLFIGKSLYVQFFLLTSKTARSFKAKLKVFN